MWRAEWSKLFSRTSAKVGMLLLVAFSAMPPLFMHTLSGSEVSFNGSSMDDLMSASAAKAIVWTVWANHRFALMPAFISLLGALSFAGDYQSKTLREDLLRPVPRWSVLLVKWAAMCTWITMAALLCWLTSLGLSVALFGVEGDWTSSFYAWGTALLCDCSFAALVLCLAVLLRSVAGTIIGVVIFVVFDTVLGWALSLVAMAGDSLQAPVALELAIQARPWLPSSAFGLWSTFGAGGDPAVWQNFAALAAITVASGVLATLRFRWMDVP